MPSIWSVSSVIIFLLTSNNRGNVAQSTDMSFEGTLQKFGMFLESLFGDIPGKGTAPEIGIMSS